MTTAVHIDVNGRYKATVVQTDADGTERSPVEIHGRYDGSPNPEGKHTFWLPHPASASFKVTEEYLGEAQAPAPDGSAATGADPKPD